MECNVVELGYMKPRRGILEQDEVLAKDKILLKRYQARLEHRNASSSDEKIRTVTVPGQTLERDKAHGTRSSRQSKSKTATGKSTKSVAIK